MTVLEHRIEAVITHDDVDENWQLVDAAATLAPTRPLVRTADADFVAALAGR